MLQKVPTLLQLLFWLMTRCICWLMMGCISCIIVAVIIVLRHGMPALQALLNNDYHFIAVRASQQSLIFLNYCLHAIPDSISNTSISLADITSSIQHDFLNPVLPWLTVIVAAVKLALMRLYLLYHWCFLFILLGGIGLIDGLAQRAIRRSAGGRESTLIYHSIKPLIMVSLLFGIFLVLSLPISASHAEWLFFIAAIVFAVALQITAKRFKKYL